MTISILDYLERSADRLPSKKALVDENRALTYQELRENAQKLGVKILKDFPGKKSRPIVVFVDRKLECLIAFFGVAYSGNFYVPIDIEMPKERIKLILETLNPIAIVNTPSSIGFAKEIAPEIPEIDLSLSIDQTSIDESVLKGARESLIDLDPVYATFTSGSTGIPKGVLTCHRSVVDMTENLIETFGFDENRVFGNQNPFYFDASIKDFYGSIASGSTFHILPKRLFLMLGELVDYMEAQKIDTILWSAAAIALLANANAFEESRPAQLKQVMFSGEVMHNKVLNYWRKHLPETLFVNLYGPTEITSVCTYYKVEKPFNDDEVLPIGKAFPNCEVILLDENDELISGTEKAGEICVRGACLALGYYNNPEKTNEAFISNPFFSAFTDRVYRTGDLARYNEKKEIMFMSRKDNQVKHMGQRVELGEIEIVMNSMDLIDASFCFYDHSKEKIIAVYSGDGADKKYIYANMRERLSKFMFPNVLVKLSEMPYNLNGKIDRPLIKDSYFEGKYS